MGLFGKRKGASSAVDTDWADDGVLEAPRVGTDDYKKTRRRRKLMRGFVWTSVISLPVFGLVFAVILANLLTPPEPEDVSVDSPHKGRAMIEVENWLDTYPEPVPGGELLSWNSVQTLPQPEPKDNEEEPVDPPVVEVHKLTVASETGALFDVDVQLETTDANGTTVVAGPSLLPQVPRGQRNAGGSQNPWPTLEDTTVTDSGEAAVQQWAQAFTSGKPDQLRLAVGDPDGAASYVPLNGVGVEGINVRKAGIREMTEPEGEEEAEPQLIVAQVRLTLNWDNPPADSDSGAPTDEASAAAAPTEEPQDAEDQYVDYDVLIDDASTASPRVVAWGGPGTGVWLEPYGNAIHGRQLTDRDAEAYANEPTEEPGAPASEAPAEESEDSQAPADSDVPEVENDTEN